MTEMVVNNDSTPVREADLVGLNATLTFQIMSMTNYSVPEQIDQVRSVPHYSACTTQSMADNHSARTWC